MKPILMTFSAVLLATIWSNQSLAQAQFGYLVQQDFSDCQNGDVREGTPTMGGTIGLSRSSDGNTTVKIAITAGRNTTYHFFLKCIRHLGDFTTDDEGIATTSFTFRTNEAGNIFAFDSYPEGAPLGNKFQSTQVKY